MSTELFPLHTGKFKLDGGAMFGVVPKSIWNKLNPADEKNLCTWALRCLLIKEGNRLILVDNGLGDKQDEKFFGHYYLQDTKSFDELLASHGFHRDDITDVILTHLHFDHCGGSIVKKGASLVPAFKNAVYWSNEVHWNWAIHPNEREKASFLKENILPIQESGQLQWIPAEDGYAFSESIKLRFVYGHTEAMMLPQVMYKGRSVVFMADLLPSAAHIPMPYVMAYDVQPLLTMKEKRAFLTEALANNYILFFEHDPVVECCELEETEKGIRAGRSLSLHEI